MQCTQWDEVVESKHEIQMSDLEMIQKDDLIMEIIVSKYTLSCAILKSS